jgi:very-short-patch-repair endonuclease
MLDVMLRRLARDQWVRLHGTPRVTVLVGGSHGREIWNQWISLSGVPGTLVDGEPGAGEAAPDGAPERAFDDQIRAAVARAVDQPAHPIAVLVTAEVASRWRTGRRDRLAAMVDEGWIAVPEPPHDDAQHASGHRSQLDGRGGWDGQSQLDGHGGWDGQSQLDAQDASEGRASREVASGGPERYDGGVAEAPLASDALDADASGPPLDAGESARALFYFDARSVAEATLFEALEATPATAGRFRLNESLSVRFGPAAAEVDLLSRGDRIAIEIDGMHHFADLVCYRRDRRKDLLLQTQGFVVVRLLAEDVVRDVRSAVTAIHQVLAYRLGEGQG